MKFAVPTYQGKLCLHFGHCEVFTIVTAAKDNQLTAQTVTPPPHEPGVLPKWLSEQGVNCVIAGGMGVRAQDLFKAAGVNVIVGASVKTPEELVTDYLNGNLQCGANTCDH